MKKYFILCVFASIFMVLFAIGCDQGQETQTIDQLKPPAELPKEQPAAEKTVVKQPVPPVKPTQEPNVAKPVVPAATPPAKKQLTPVERMEIIKKLRAAIDVNAVAVTVNGVDITEGQTLELYKRQMDFVADMNETQQKTAIQGYRASALDRLITETAVKTKIEEAKLVITPDDVNEHMEKMAAQRGMTAADLKKAVAERYKSFDEWKKVAQIELAIGFERLAADRFPDFPLDVNETDAKKYYNENISKFQEQEAVRASHILIKPASDPNRDPNELRAVARTKAEEILKKLLDGADFATLAKENSQCPSASKGGDLGFFPRTGMVKTFSDAAFALEVGQLSGVVETMYGYHIIKVTEKRPGGPKPFDGLKDQLVRFLAFEKQRELNRKFMDVLKTESKIVYPPGKEPVTPAPAPAPR